MTNVLFICKFNRFRSKVAEAVFNKINKNYNYKVKSAGIIKGNPLDKNQVSFSKERGYVIKNPSQGVSSKLLKWQDVIIIVADDVPKSLFSGNVNYGKRLIAWNIKDAKSDDKKEVMRIIDEIEEQVTKFVNKIK